MALGKSRPSPIGERIGADGYTLIELLVVVAVIGLLLLSAPALLKAARPGVEAKAAARALAADLRAARTTAVVGNAETWVIFNAAEHEYVIQPGDVVRKFPSGVSLDLRDARGAPMRKAGLRFFPDGSSTGGRIGIAAGGEQHWVTGHWLTGRVTIDE